MKRLGAASRVVAGLVGAALCASVCLLAAPTAAGAAVNGLELDVNGTGFTAMPTTSLLNASNLLPGSAVSGTVGVRNQTTGAGSITVKFTDVTSSENGCTPSESAMPGGCDPTGPGQLGEELVFSLARASGASGSYTGIWSGSASQLVAGVPVDSSLSGGGSTWLRLTAELPRAAGNSTQSDVYTFGLAVVFTASIPSSEIKGIAITHGPNGSIAVVPPPLLTFSGLGFTGVSAGLLVAIALLLLASGALLVLRARDVRGRPSGGS